MPPFVHLHVRSHYSPLRSAARLKDIVKAAAKVGSPAVCVTDVGNLHAAVHLQRECERAGLRPIFGAELTLSDTGPLVFLARNARGWESLSDLCSRLRCGVPVSAEEAGSMQGLAVLTGGADGDLQCAADRVGCGNVSAQEAYASPGARQPLGQAQPQVRVHHVHARKALPVTDRKGMQAQLLVAM